MKHFFRQLTIIVSAVVIGVTSFTYPVMAQEGNAEVNETNRSDYYTENDILYYDPTSGACGANNVVGSGLPKLDGYELPANKGRTGFEEKIDANGQIPSGGTVTFSKFAKLGQAYRDYYITMRWRYVKWNWNGTASGGDAAQVRWMNDKPRLVLVTNPRTKKSIIAVALEAGPAPWTGVDLGNNNNPKQGWVNPQDGTPPNYTGRVSGFPPVAIAALGAKQGMAEGAGGGGDELIYSWAPDQNAKPGPVNIIQQETAQPVTTDQVGCANTEASFVNAEGYAMPIGLPKADLSNGYGWPCRSICHHDGTGAFDLAHKKTISGGEDGLTVGAPIYAIHEGTVKVTRNTYNGISGCGSIQLAEGAGGGDTWTYWYGHISSDIEVKVGQKVTAGQAMGKVGLRKCTGNGSYPHLHIDQGSPKGHYGGSVGARNRGFVGLMNSIYESMP